MIYGYRNYVLTIIGLSFDILDISLVFYSTIFPLSSGRYYSYVFNWEFEKRLLFFPRFNIKIEVIQISLRVLLSQTEKNILRVFMWALLFFLLRIIYR